MLFFDVLSMELCRIGEDERYLFKCMGVADSKNKTRISSKILGS